MWRSSGTGQNVVKSQYSYYDWEEQGGCLQQILASVPGDLGALQDLS